MGSLFPRAGQCDASVPVSFLAHHGKPLGPGDGLRSGRALKNDESSVTEYPGNESEESVHGRSAHVIGRVDEDEVKTSLCASLEDTLRGSSNQCRCGGRGQGREDRLDVRGDCPHGTRIAVDKGGMSCTSRKGFEAQRPTSGVEIDDDGPAKGHAVVKLGKDGLPDPVARRPGRALGDSKRKRAGLPRDDSRHTPTVYPVRRAKPVA